MLFELDFFLRLLLAAIFGGIIGLEREVHERPAGLRTHSLVCMGAALFVIVSLNFIEGNPQPAQIASNIVVGIGFIGAGAIFKSENHVKGLTTATDLWVVAGVGMLMGLGAFSHAILAAVMVWIILIIGRRIRSTVPKEKIDTDS